MIDLEAMVKLIALFLLMLFINCVAIIFLKG